jgi:hypothetical protein
MKTFILALLLLPTLTYAQATNNPAHLKKGETWSSASRLERIAKAHAEEEKIEFAFEKAERSVSVEKRGANIVATIWFFSGMGKPVLGVEVAPSGQVITNHIGIAVCGTGRNL